VKRGKKGDSKPPASSVLATGTKKGEDVALKPYVMLWRYWKAYSEKPPPKELRGLLERVFVVNGLYLYVH
jgi:hypothetical protein